MCHFPESLKQFNITDFTHLITIIILTNSLCSNEKREISDQGAQYSETNI